MKKYFVFALAVMATMFVACSDDKENGPSYYEWSIAISDGGSSSDSHSFGVLESWVTKISDVALHYDGHGEFASDEEAIAKGDKLEEQLAKLEQDFIDAQEEMDFGTGSIKREFAVALMKDGKQLKVYPGHKFDYTSAKRFYASKVYAPENFANTLEQSGTITVEEHYNLSDLALESGVVFTLNGDAKIYKTSDHLIYKGAKFAEVKAENGKELVITYTFNKENLKDYQSSWNILVPVNFTSPEKKDNCFLSLDIDLTK